MDRLGILLRRRSVPRTDVLGAAHIGGGTLTYKQLKQLEKLLSAYTAKLRHDGEAGGAQIANVVRTWVESDRDDAEPEEKL